MGEWSEAVNDGLICMKCFLPLNGASVLAGPALCQVCAAEKGKQGGSKIGPNWLPPRG